MMDVRKSAGGQTVLTIEGPVRLAQVGELLDLSRAAAAQGGDVEVDLSAAEHIHTGGLQILRALEREVLAAQARFGVIAASESARDALNLCGLARWLPIGKAD
jgi:anti-anti-sigma regulatory factor